MNSELKINVSGKESIEEVYFMLRTATWHQEHLTAWIDIQNDAQFEDGYSAGVDYAKDTYGNDNRWEDEWQKGYDQGFEDGHKAGCDEGYDDGYTDGAKG